MLINSRLMLTSEGQKQKGFINFYRDLAEVWDQSRNDYSNKTNSTLKIGKQL